MQYEVSMAVSMGRTTNQRKVPNWLPFKNNIGDNMYIGKPNMKFLCLTLWQGKGCTDDDDDANNDANANDNREGMIV